MSKFTLEYWPDGDGYVGRLKEVPGVVSQGDSVAELRENIKDAYHLLMSGTLSAKRYECSLA
jgi:predicted RNase H-like HicB family nuclease